MAKHFEIRAKDEVSGIYSVEADSYEEAVCKLRQGHWYDYIMEDFAPFSEPYDFEFYYMWEDPEPEVEPKDTYDRTLVDVMDESSDS